MAADSNKGRMRGKRVGVRQGESQVVEGQLAAVDADRQIEQWLADRVNGRVSADRDEAGGTEIGAAQAIESAGSSDVADLVADAAIVADGTDSLSEFARGWAAQTQGWQFAQAAPAAASDASAGAASAGGGSGLLGSGMGLGSLFGVIGGVGLIAGGAGGSSSAGAAPQPVTTTPIEVINGYISGAKVGQDRNGNGKLDADEIQGQTDAQGRITLRVDPAGGVIRTEGGTDLSTGKPVTNSFSAPAQSTVVSPISTVIAAAVASGESLSKAVAAVRTAFGIDADVDLLNLDPVETALGSGAPSDQAMKVKAAAVQISNTLDLGASVLSEAGTAVENSGRMADALAKAILASGGAPVNLASSDTLGTVIGNAVGNSTLSGAAREKAQSAVSTAAYLAANANAVVAEAVNAPDHKEALTVIARAQRVAQVEASDALGQAIRTGGSLGDVVSQYTGSEFANKASQVAEGVISPSVAMVNVAVLPTTVAPPAGSNFTSGSVASAATLVPIGSVATAGLTAGRSGEFSVKFSTAPASLTAANFELGSGLTVSRIEKLTDTRYVVTVDVAADAIGSRSVKLAAGWAGQTSTGDELTVKVNPPFSAMRFDESAAKVLPFEGAVAEVVKLFDGNSVMRFAKPLTAKPYAGTSLALTSADTLGTIDMSAGNTKLGMWVHAPQAGLPIRLQLASSDAGTVSRYTQAGQPQVVDDRKFVETEIRTTKAGWQWMEFDFNQPVERWVGVYETAIKVALDPELRYDRVSVFPDFNAAPTGASFYFDALTRGGTPPAMPAEPPTKFATLDFEGEASSYRQAVFGGASSSLVADPEDASNVVVKVTKASDAEIWAGVTLSTLPGDAYAIPAIPFESGSVMTAAVYSPAPGTKVRLKAENASDPTISVETEMVTKFAGWETVRFDFSKQLTGTAALDVSKQYNKLSTFFDFDVAGSNGRSYLIDDIRFLGAASAAPGNPVPAGYTLAFEDNFDSASKTSPNPAVWKFDLGDGSKKGIPGWGNGEQQYYTADLDNVFVEDGNLHIIAKANDTATNTADRINASGAVVPFTTGITSARLTTQGQNLAPYGYVEVRAKLPAEQGAWPAIWMLGEQGTWPQSGEIDIVEWSGRYFNDTTVQAALHTGQSYGNTVNKGSTTLDSTVERFHTYQLWWSPTEIRVGVDGDANSAYYRYLKDPAAGVGQWPFDSSFYLLLNVAVGGTLGGDGFAQALAQAPYEMVVDYVRVYQGAANPSSSPLKVTFETSDTSGYTVGDGADFGGSVSSVVSDGPVGSSGRVAKVVKTAGAETWAGTTVLALTGKEVISAGNETVTMKVYSPEAGAVVMLKVENGANGNQFIEKLATTTKAGEWETLSFNFAGANHAVDYTKASVFLDFGNAGTGKTFYLDDIAVGGATPAATYTAPANLKVSFESNDASGYTLGGTADFGGSVSSLATDGPSGSSGNVGKVVKGAGAETWAGTTFLTLSGKELIANGAETVTLRVYSPEAGAAVLLKLENAANGNQFAEKQVTTTKAGEWETLSFSFAGANHAVDYTRASVFFDFGKAGTGKTFYFDDVAYDGATLNVPVSVTQAVGVSSFETSDTSGYTVGDGADFGGSVSSVVSDGPVGSSGRVAKVVKTAGAETWAGTTVLALTGKEVISAGNETVTMKVYSPEAGAVVMLKVENGANGNQFIEKLATTTKAGEWETLSFNFAGANHAVDYTKASVFLDFGNAGTGKTFYLDDIAVGGATPAATYTAPANLKVSFESNDASGYTLGGTADFGGSVSSLATDGPSGSSGNVGKVVKGAGAETWAGTTFLTLSGKELIANGAETVTLRVYSPEAGAAVLLKLENAANGNQFAEKQVTTTKAGEWETLSFSFAGANHAVDYTRASVFFDFGKAGTGKTFYFDDVAYDGATLNVPVSVTQAVGVSSFETSDTSGYTVGDGADFGGSVSSVVSDGPVGSSGRVAKVVKTAGAETWAGTTVLALTGKEVISAGNETVTMKVYSPEAGAVVMLKVENGANGNQFIEKLATTTKAGEWETLSFNFAGANHAVDYTKASVFLDFGNAGTGKTFYLDDVAVGGATPAVSPVSRKIDFDATDADYQVGGTSDFGNAVSSIATDPVASGNSVAKVIKPNGAEVWAGTTFLKVPGYDIISPTSETVGLKVWAPAAGIPVRLKLETIADNTKTVETQVNTTAEGWQDLSFNFANPASGTAPLNHANTFDMASVFFDFGNAGSGKTFYFDDVSFRVLPV